MEKAMITIRDYRPSDWNAIEQIHDAARKIELHLAGLDAAFLPLRVAAEREGLLEYPGLFVAEWDGTVVGFAACSEDELAWLYVAPAHMRKGIGRSLIHYAVQQYPGIHELEVLVGNEPAKALYEQAGFEAAHTMEGKMPGNESFSVNVYVMTRRIG